MNMNLAESGLKDLPPEFPFKFLKLEAASLFACTASAKSFYEAHSVLRVTRGYDPPLNHIQRRPCAPNQSAAMPQV